MNELFYCLFMAWYILCGFSFAKSARAGSTLVDSRAPFGMVVILWGILMPISGLFKGD